MSNSDGVNFAITPAGEFCAPWQNAALTVICSSPNPHKGTGERKIDHIGAYELRATNITRIEQMITHHDVRCLLAGYCAAIELDQIWVDTLPAERFHPDYDDGMWRRHRRGHLEFIDRLFPTVTAMPSELLQGLERLAISYKPSVVEDAIVDFLSFVVTDEGSAEEFGSAPAFFGTLVEDVSRAAAPELPFEDDAKERMEDWLAPTDPLRIAQDPEFWG